MHYYALHVTLVEPKWLRETIEATGPKVKKPKGWTFAYLDLLNA